MSNVLSIIISIISILSLITIHEWGHFIVARLFKVPVYEFAIGMGPLLYQKKGKKETIYSIRLIPLGGYCAFSNNKDAAVNDSGLSQVSPLKRIAIISAGPIINIFSSFLLIFMVFNFIGTPILTPVISSIANESLIDSGLQVNDEIYSINGVEMNGSVEKLQTLITSLEPIDLIVLREKEKIDLQVIPMYLEEENQYYLGVSLYSDYQKENIIEASKSSIIYLYDTTANMLSSIGKIFTGQVKISQMSGIVGIVNYMSDISSNETQLTKIKIANFINTAAIISLNLGIVNLIPIPGLDGAKILTSTVEILIKKKISPKIEGIVSVAGFLFLIGFIFVVTISDIIKIAS